VAGAGAHAVVLGALSGHALSLLHGSLLDDLLNNFFLLAGAEFGLEGLIGGAVEGTLLALLAHEHLEGADDLSEGNALVGLPLLGGLDVVDEDDEVLGLALVVALDD